jgi:hypothetical protein
MRFFKGKVNRSSRCRQFGFQEIQVKTTYFNLAVGNLEKICRKKLKNEFSHGFIMGEASTSHMGEYTDFWLLAWIAYPQLPVGIDQMTAYRQE